MIEQGNKKIHQAGRRVTIGVMASSTAILALVAAAKYETDSLEAKDTRRQVVAQQPVDSYQLGMIDERVRFSSKAAQEAAIVGGWLAVGSMVMMFSGVAASRRAIREAQRELSYEEAALQQAGVGGDADWNPSLLDISEAPTVPKHPPQHLPDQDRGPDDYGYPSGQGPN